MNDPNEIDEGGPLVNVQPGWTSELIQVAAVAVAAVEDALFGAVGRSRDTIEYVLDLVFSERERQNRQWGIRHHRQPLWLAILAEEVGEAAREVEITIRSERDERSVRDRLVDAERWARTVLARYEREQIADE